MDARKGILLPILLLSVFLIIVLISPMREVFEYNRDEGTTLMGASLFMKGFPLYSKIWLDQTPLFTVILSHWLKIFGPSVFYGRILVLIFSLILLWAFYQTIKVQSGNLAAFMAVVFLLLSNAYAHLSVSVMIGVPSLAFAMLSVYCLTLYRKLYLKYLLVLSAVFMALSLETKLFTAFLILPVIVEIVRSKGVNSKGEKAPVPYPLLLWFICFLGVFLAIAIVFFRFDFKFFISQLLQPHLRGEIMLREKFDFSVIWPMILTDYDIVLLALTGVILFNRQQQQRRLIFPILWLVLALVILLEHRPAAYHYYLLISIPICWLAGVSFAEFYRTDIRRGWFIEKNKYGARDVFLRWTTAGLIILTILLAPAKYSRVLIALQGAGKASPQEQAVVDLLRKYRAQTEWVITDRPIFAFYADMLVPPEFAIIGKKRSFLDEAAQDYYIDTLEKYKAKAVLMQYGSEFYGPKVISYLKKNYDNIYEGQVPDRH